MLSIFLINGDAELTFYKCILIQEVVALLIINFNKRQSFSRDFLKLL